MAYSWDDGCMGMAFPLAGTISSTGSFQPPRSKAPSIWFRFRRGSKRWQERGARSPYAFLDIVVARDEWDRRDLAQLLGLSKERCDRPPDLLRL